MKPFAAFSILALALVALPLSAGLSQRLQNPASKPRSFLDTTRSMGGLIEGAKRKIWSIATVIADANPDAEIRMGLVAYRDIGDEYVTKTFDLTTDIQDLYANLLELKARGGGDWPESVNEALEVAVNKLRWTPAGDVRRIVFLVGDAPPHMDYAQDTKYPTTLAVAKQKDIIVNPVLAGNARDTERVWRDIAQNGNGRFIPLPQDGNALNEKLAALVAKRQLWRGSARQGPVQGVVVRPRGRGYAEGADQAVSSLVSFRCTNSHSSCPGLSRP
jgi:hypothetical protein